MQVIKSSIKEVMATKSWFEAPEEVVLKILQIDTMEISEPLLFENLVKWGRAQVEDEADVRAKIDKCLKLVRFCSMSCAEFSNLCFKPNPLTAEEKYKIFLSITQNNTSLLPKRFSNSKKPRLQRIAVQWIKVNFFKCDVDRQTVPSVLTLKVEPLHYLLGVFLYSLTDINAGELVYLICDVYSSEDLNLCIESANFRGIVQANGNGELLFDRPVLMKKGFSYKFEVTYKHSTKIQTAAFQKEASGPWVWKVQAVSVIINPNKAVPVDPPIVDISGLILAKNI